MQFYRDGFYPGDPTVHRATTDRSADDNERDEVDVLIVGSGPAGNLLAAHLSQFPDISTRIVERGSGRMELGQADGIACRTVETFEAFGLARRLTDEAYWVNETTFWRPRAEHPENIVRTGRVQDVEDGLSEFPHVIINQARIHDYLLDFMERSPTRLVPDYGLEFVSLTVDRGSAHPVIAQLCDVESGEHHTVRAKYLVGTDGARSGVRKAIGRQLRGDTAGHAWGVMDILADTDFPDIRLKSAIQSAGAGSILLIPREGGYLVRLYVDLGPIDETNRQEVRQRTGEQIVAIANRVLHPYTITVHETVWWSIYEVGQRLTDGFDDVAGHGSDPRVFIAGDACHTHSAKAGQGMNVSMQDALNLGWKLSTVLRGLSDSSLLETYSQERQPVAQQLIDFDRKWSAMMAAGPNDSGDPNGSGVNPDELKDYFVQAGRYTAGLGVQYPASRLIGSGAHQSLATGFEVGTRFHSFPVVRIADALKMELGHVHRADGRFRLYIFAGASESSFLALCDWLARNPESPIVRHTPHGWDVDSVIDVRGIFQRPHHEIQPGELPVLLRPHTGRYGLVDQEKAFSGASRDDDIFTGRDINRDAGAVVIVRPDQYVAEVLPLEDRESISAYFAGILR